MANGGELNLILTFQQFKVKRVSSMSHGEKISLIYILDTHLTSSLLGRRPLS